MAEPVYESGKLRAVWYKTGERDDGTPKLKRANFDVLQWAPVSGGVASKFVVPLGISRVDGKDLNDLVSIDAADVTEVGQEFGYYDGKNFVIEQHQHDGSDSIWGVHGFGYL
jgi:hypothetical protein